MFSRAVRPFVAHAGAAIRPRDLHQGRQPKAYLTALVQISAQTIVNG
jgi:hypothetical protein